MNYSKNFDLENAIEDTKFQLDQQFMGVEIIKNHARDIFSSLSLIMALIGILKISEMQLDFYHLGIREIVLLLAGLIYLYIAYANAVILQPTAMRTPVKIDRQYLHEIYNDKSPRQILDTKLNHYIDTIEENSSVLKRKVDASKYIVYAYFFVIILLLFSVIIP